MEEDWSMPGLRDRNSLRWFGQMPGGSEEAEVLTTSKRLRLPGSFSPDGKILAFQEHSPDTGIDLWILPIEGDRQPVIWLKTKFNEWGPTFSHDGKWVAYTSDESGQYEVYMRPYPGPGERHQISTAGGEEVLWSRDGRSLYYRDGPRWFAVVVEMQPEFRVGATKTMFEGPFLNVPGLSYDVAPDGQHFVMIEENQKRPPTTQLNVVSQLVLRTEAVARPFTRTPIASRRGRRRSFRPPFRQS